MDKRTTKPILGEYRLSLRVQEAANALGISRAKSGLRFIIYKYN